MPLFFILGAISEIETSTRVVQEEGQPLLALCAALGYDLADIGSLEFTFVINDQDGKECSSGSMHMEIIESPYEDNSTAVPDVDGEILEGATKTQVASTVPYSTAILHVPPSCEVENTRACPPGLNKFIVCSVGLRGWRFA
jgi:hypothetical protein